MIHFITKKNKELLYPGIICSYCPLVANGHKCKRSVMCGSITTVGSCSSIGYPPVVTVLKCFVVQ